MKGLLIGGTSHCGKSTLAKVVGEALGWRITSTDALARHPGRPWLNVPEPVKEFYGALTPETIYWFLRVHHTNMRPLLERVIADERRLEDGFVLEGSALRPEFVSALAVDDVLSVCLHAEADFLRDRIQAGSGYDGQDARLRRLIDAFIERSLRDNEAVVADARDKNIRLIDAGNAAAFRQATAELVERLGGRH